MITPTAPLDEKKYATAAARMLSGMIVLYLISAGAAAIIAFAVAAIVLMLHREHAYDRMVCHIAAGIGTAAVCWVLLYCRSDQMRIVVPLSQFFS